MLKVILGKVLCNTKKYSSAAKINGSSGWLSDGWGFHS